MAKLGKAETIECEIIAAHLLGCRLSDYEVRKQLRNGDFKLNNTQAIRIVKKIRDRWQAETEAVVSDIRSQAYRTLDEACMLAFKQKDVRAVVAVERLRAEIAGLTKIDVHVGGPARQEDVRPWGDSEKEADCFGIFGKLSKDLSADERETYATIKATRAN